MAQPIIQPSFAAGELSPSLWSRVDLGKYHVGAALLRNFFVDYRGGAANRAGTQYINHVKDSANPVRLIPFQFSSNESQNYVLEFGHLYMRVIVDGGHVLETPVSFSAATQANPCVITRVAHGFATGDWVYFNNPGAMTQLGGKYYVITVLNANTFSLANLDGTAVDSTAFTAYAGGGELARVYTLTTPYAGVDLALLKYTQSADVMTLTHRAYAPRNLSRTGHASWTITTITFAPTQAAPTAPTSVASSTIGPNTGYRYVITAVSADGTEESLPSATTTVNSDAMSTTAGAKITVGWTPPAGNPVRYNIYRTDEVVGLNPPATGAIMGFIGFADGTATTFIDQNIVPDFNITPPSTNNPFASNNHPGCVTYFQGRRWYGGSALQPQTVWASRTSNFDNMTFSYPSKATDFLEATILSQQVNAIQFMVPLNQLLVLTKGGAWKIWAGNNADAVKPDAISADPQVYNGCNEFVPPLVVDYDILYVQAKGSIVRDLSYNLYLNVFTGVDLSAMANHLLFGHTIVEWAWSEEPYKIVWAVREDGKLLGFTFMKEQEVSAWSQHDTINGRFLSVASIPEGREDAVYFVVQRYINGQFLQYIERLATRDFQGDVTQAWFVDSGLRYPLTYLNAVAQPIANDWEAQNKVDQTLTIKTSASVFDFAKNITSVKSSATGEVWSFNGTARVKKDADGVNYLSLPGTSGNYASTPDSAAASVTGDIDIRVKVAMNDWTPSPGQIPDLIAKGIDAPTAAWKLEVLGADFTAGALNFQTSANGSDLINHFSTAAVGAADGSVKWVRVTLDADNGAAGHDVKFYTSDDGVTWSQLGATVTTAGITSIFDNSAAVEIGNNPEVGGKYYYAEIRNGIAGPVAAKFDAEDVVDNGGDVIRINGGRLEVTSVVSATEVKAKVLIPLRDQWPAGVGDWSYTTPISSVSGLDHLEGQEVAILADGGSLGRRVVSNASVSLDQPSTDITVGLPIKAQLQSLYIDTEKEGGTIQGKPINVNACSVRVVNSRGLKLGNSFERVVPIKERTQNTIMGIPIPLVTGDERVIMDPHWKLNAQVCAQQDEPLPAQILGIIPEISIGD